MSNTMRTDEVNKYLRTRDEYAKTDHEIWVNHARQLERELNAANERIKRLEEMYEGVIGERPELLGSNVMGLLKRELTGTQKRIKRMEEENNELRSEEARLLNTKGELERRIKRLEEAGDKIVEAGWSVQDWSGMCVVWAKAKEDKL